MTKVDEKPDDITQNPGSIRRFTAYGGPEVEARLADIVAKVAHTLQEGLTPQDFRAVVLMGGYGRGEGGVEITNGVEKPHNNLDFLLIARDLPAAALQQLKAALDARLATLSAQEGVELTLGTTTEATLHGAPCLIMWYDVRYGHRTILGDEQFVPSLTRFTVERILPSDARNLLVNRGTLLVINDYLLQQGANTPAIKRMIIKHAMKAIIGYGDALLFFLGDYHWSYQEKQRRMRNRADVPEDFRALYDMAVEFRFLPKYDRWLACDLRDWMQTLRTRLSEVHLTCERARLHTEIDWDRYPDIAFAQVLTEDGLTLRSVAKRARNLLRGLQAPSTLPLRARLGCRAAGAKGVLPILFPYILYYPEGQRNREIARTLLNAANTSPDALRDAYLRAWGAHGDINFHVSMGQVQEAK